MVLEMLGDEVSQQVQDVDKRVGKYMDDIDKMVGETQLTINDVADRLELLTSTSINDICGRIPLCDARYSIRSFSPTTIKPNPVGNSIITIKGSAIRDDAKCTVIYGGQILQSELVYRGKNANTLVVEIPAGRLQFRDYEVVRASPKLKVQHPQPWWNFWTDDQVADVSTPIFLLPVVPVRAELIESYSEAGWEECKTCAPQYPTFGLPRLMLV